jgi:predicted membrane-bound dolichyl-phosphate-mannose-protein mannosyltransferase
MLMHSVANCHNDILLAFFSTLAVFLYLKRKHLFVILACFLGVAIKYVSVVMVPFLVILLARTTSYKTAALQLPPRICHYWNTVL